MKAFVNIVPVGNTDLHSVFFDEDYDFIPTKEFDTSIGYDLHFPQDVIIRHGYNIVPLGFAVQLPPGVGMYIDSRSGVAAKGFPGYPSALDCGEVDCREHRYTAFVMHGLVDPGYTGEVGCIIYNDDSPFFAPKGTSVCQATFHYFLDAEFTVTDHLVETDRGSQGFHS